MSKKEPFTPAWTEEAPRKGTYRSILKWGDPAGFKHPNRRFYAMVKDAFQMTDADFAQRQEEGNETTRCEQPIRLSDLQVSKFRENSLIKAGALIQRMLRNICWLTVL